MMDKIETNGCVSPESLQRTLKYLYDEAMQAGLRLPAHFIGVAAEACIDEAREEDRSG